MTACTVRLPQNLLNRLRIDAKRRSMATGELIREVLTQAVSEQMRANRGRSRNRALGRIARAA